MGVDSAASAGALAQGGQVCWWLPAGFGELAAGSSSPVVRGPGGVFPVSAPRQLARSVRCVAWSGGPSSAPSSSQQSLFTPEQLVGARPSLFPPVSPSGSRRDPHGERFDSQSVCGPLSQSFWLGLRHGS